MKKSRVIVLISCVFSLLVSAPRVLFLLNGKPEAAVNGAIEVTLTDTALRGLLLFGFSLAVLKFNMDWAMRIPGGRRLGTSVAVNALILAIWLALFQLIHAFAYDFHASTLSPFVNGLTYFFFLLLLVLLSQAIVLVEKSKFDALEKERLKQNSLQNKMDALKNQMNPHFLFNSLNTLTLLIRQDQQAAELFVQKLAFLFRHMLQNKEQDGTTVKEDLSILESYLHLMQHRYKENLAVRLNIDESMYAKQVPIFALQVLMENAIKHNEISDRNPLQVDIYSNNEEVVFRNALQERVGHVEGTNTGLANLNSRVKLLMGKELKIFKDSAHFTVHLPVS